MTAPDTTAIGRAIAVGDELRREGRLDEAMSAYLAVANGCEIPDARVSVRLARNFLHAGEPSLARRWALRVVDAGDDYATWHAAARVIAALPRADPDAGAARSATARVLSSYTTTQLVPLLALAALRRGVALEVTEAPYGQYRQEVLDPSSPLYESRPDFAILAVHEGDLALPAFSPSPSSDVDAEVQRWTSLWQKVRDGAGARPLQHSFALRPDGPFGHLAARLPGARATMAEWVNLRLGAAAANDCLFVDCDRLAGQFGKRAWFDDRYWHLSRQAMALGALPLLARHTAAVIAADLGLTRKCVVVDLDNTLWGGEVGEAGLRGVRLGDGPDGEAFVAFQEYLLSLRDRGVLLAVCSKNDEHRARDVLDHHPDMRIRSQHLAAFAANWEPKCDNLRVIAGELGLGLDGLVFVDDNPAERDLVRRLLPEVEVVALGNEPSQYRRALAESLLLEPAAYTPDDAQKAVQYQARARLGTLRAAAESLEDFYRSLGMTAEIAPFDEPHLPRIAQLVAKTNQFNLTTKRHAVGALRQAMVDPDAVHLYLRLRDRFADHGLVSVAIAHRTGETLDVDTWVMSCRVVGRTVEATMLAHLCDVAIASGCRAVRGTFAPSGKNGLVAELYPRLGFRLIADAGGVTTWELDLATRVPSNEFITSQRPTGLSVPATQRRGGARDGVTRPP
ncbi:MAG: HAD-IIIC family phosphatase [Anaerolineales bacterium]